MIKYNYTGVENNKCFITFYCLEAFLISSTNGCIFSRCSKFLQEKKIHLNLRSNSWLP